MENESCVLRDMRLSESQAINSCVNINSFRSFCREEEWTEYSDGIGKKVKGKIWTDAFSEALKASGRVYVPNTDEIMYIDAPIVLKSAGVLWVHPNTRIYLRPGMNTCMVRNENADKNGRDRTILVSGGIWSTLTRNLFGVET